MLPSNARPRPPFITTSRHGSIPIFVLIALAAAVCTSAAAHAAARQADFNGDGRADLAIGVPNENVAGQIEAGAVAVIYGHPAAGLSAIDDQFWTVNSTGITGEPEAGALFGQALASGDFDGDGFSDLAIGIPHQTVDRVSFAGAVEVIYGSAAGLNAAGDQRWTRFGDAVLGDPISGASFGLALAAGDFNDDGHDDLAIGVPGQDVALQNVAGEVHILYGTAAGLSDSGDQIFNQETPGIANSAEANDFLGEALTSGDFNNDGRDDLAIGVPRENHLAIPDSGIVHVLYGSPSGLTIEGAQIIEQGIDGVQNIAEEFDLFGISLVSGNFDGDGFDDLAIGVTGEAVGGNAFAGAVAVLYGTAEGLGTEDDQVWSQERPGVLDDAESSDVFGSAFAAGDFDGDGFDDLAIGVLGESVGVISTAGAVNVLYGTPDGLRAAGNQFWHQNSTGILDPAETDDSFGSALTAGDYDGDGFDDLVVGVPAEAIGAINLCGAVNVIYGTRTGLHKAGNQFWHQDSTGIRDTAENSDGFGFAVR